MTEKSYLALIWEQGKKDTKEYYHKDRKGWIFNIGSALIVAIISPIVFGAMGLIMANQLGLSILAGLISGILFLGLWFLIVFIYHLANAPASLFREQQHELEKYGWSKIEFEEVPYSVMNISGWALKITNNKSFDLHRIEIRLTEIRVDQNIYNKPSKVYYFGSIDYEDERLVDHFETDNKGIKQGNERSFAITGIIPNFPVPVRKFMTYAESDLKLPFPDISVPPLPLVVIEITIGVYLKIGDEKINLPQKIMKLEVTKDGAIRIRNNEGETVTKKSQKEPTKKAKTPKEGILTKDEFLKALDKVIGVVKPKKSPSKGKSKTSE
ncbi:MAG: hypothetical protein QY302_00655 [Anaerolineales bacterium]|nr:MAG: hypothetical protein QY302_12440 [Anaerolineales bacterium]WKZ43194.1 MAG: hypothetical protein QY302_13920 [Anaerolineales bacterium]WKZ44281.1 MAG: hypothetical protein QY302_00655 [Anaerolineales bacterium]